MLKTLWLDKKLLGIPRTLMPDNMKFFEKIMIMHFNTRTLDFLRCISTLFLFNDVNLHFDYFSSSDKLAKLCTIFDHVVPLFHQIHSLAFDHHAIPLIEQYFGPKLAQVKMITLDLFSVSSDPATVQAINLFMNWLTTEGRDPTEPRFLKVSTFSENFQQFCTTVRQQFLLTNAPCTFAIGLNCYDNNNQVASFHLENNLEEQLDGHINELGSIKIVRHKQVDSARTQLEEWVNETAKNSVKSSGIQLYGFTTIGPIDAKAGARMIMPGKKKKRIKPSAAKKPKLI